MRAWARRLAFAPIPGFEPDNDAFGNRMIVSHRSRWLMAFARAGLLAVCLAVATPALGQPDTEREPDAAPPQEAPRDPAEPTAALLGERLRELAEAVTARDAEAVWWLVDGHTRDSLATLHAALAERIGGLPPEARRQVPPGWHETDTLESILEIDAKGYLGVFLRSEAGTAASVRLRRIDGVSRVFEPGDDRWWPLRDIERAERAARRALPGGEQADEGRVIHFEAEGDEVRHPPTTAVYEDGRWRIRLLPGTTPDSSR